MIADWFYTDGFGIPVVLCLTGLIAVLYLSTRKKAR